MGGIAKTLDQDYPWIRLVWMDHVSSAGWYDTEAIPNGVPVCYTRAMVVEADKEKITLSHTINSNSDVVDPLTVFWGTVKELTFLSRLHTLKGKRISVPKHVKVRR